MKAVERMWAAPNYNFRVWGEQSDEEKLNAASTCPAALEEELGRQLKEGIRAQARNARAEHACIASKAKESKASTMTRDGKLKADEEASKSPSGPSMWKSGTTKGMTPSTLCVPAARAVMGILYGARMARCDLLRPVQNIATYLHQRGADCDERLQRLVSYIQSILHWRQVAWIGDDIKELGPHLYADADFAGCPRTLRSASG